MVSLFFTALIILNHVSIHFLSNLDHDFLVHLFVFWCISHCLFFLLKTENACLHHILKNAHILQYMNYNGTHFTVEWVHHRTFFSNFLQLHFKLAAHLSTYDFIFNCTTHSGPLFLRHHSFTFLRFLFHFSGVQSQAIF